MGDEFPMFGNEDITDEAVGGGFISGASRLGNKYSTPIENGAKLFMQGRSGSELNKVVNHAAKKQWSWAPSSKPNPKTDWGARSSRAIKIFFNKDVTEEADESGLDEFPMFGNEDITNEAVGGGFISGANNHARRAILMRQKFNQMNSNFFTPRI